MIKFKDIDGQTKTKIPVDNKLINTAELIRFRLGVFNNPNKNNKYTADVIFNFSDMQDGWKTNEVTLTNDLYKLNNIAYKMPAEFDFGKEWYDAAILRSRQFAKHTNSFLCTKMGFRFPGDSYKTIPFTWFNYDPVTNLVLLQVSAPIIREDDSIDFWTNHVEYETELKQEGKGMRYQWVEQDNG